MIKRIKEIFEEIQSNHKMIKSFRYCNPFDIQKTGEELYPELILENEFNLTYNGPSKIITISYYILELPISDLSDQLDLQDKTENLNDFVLAYLGLHFNKEFKITNQNSVSLIEFDGNNTCGWRTDLNLEFIRDKNICLEPYAI